LERKVCKKRSAIPWDWCSTEAGMLLGQNRGGEIGEIGKN